MSALYYDITGFLSSYAAVNLDNATKCKSNIDYAHIRQLGGTLSEVAAGQNVTEQVIVSRALNKVSQKPVTKMDEFSLKTHLASRELIHADSAPPEKLAELRDFCTELSNETVAYSPNAFRKDLIEI